MKKITFLKVLAYPASAYILFNAAGQPILAQTQEEPVPEVNVEESETPAVEEAIPEVVEENEDAVIPESAVEMEAEADTGDEMPEAVIEADQNNDPAYDEDFAKYVEEQFLGKSEEEVVKTPVFKLFKASIAGDNLSATDHEIYNILKPQLEAVARGEKTYTKFMIKASDLKGVQLQHYTAADLGVTSLLDDEGKISADASEAYFEKIDFHFRKVFEGLQADMPSELYWFDKTSSGTYYPGTTYTVRGNPSSKDGSILLDSLSFNFAVSKDYMDKSYDDIYHVDPKYGQSVQKALKNAKAIVDKYASLSDYEKLKAYAKELTELSDYNHPAMDNQQAYGDPWQIIWLFDGDPETKVVCEGYSKGFQYLANMSTFKSSELKVISVHGTSGAGNGAGAHEWNLVHMPDGKNYVVDVTNMTKDAIGAKGELFLAGTEIGNIDNGYIFKIGSDDFSLQYNEDTRSLFKDAQLLLSAFNYQEANTMRVTVKVDDYNLVEDETINYNIVLDPGKANISDIFFDVTFVAPGRDPQYFTKIQDTGFNSTAIPGEYTITVRAYDEKGNEAKGTRKFTVAPVISVSLIPDHATETYVNTDYVLTAEGKGKEVPLTYQFEQYKDGKWQVIRAYNNENSVKLSSAGEGTFQVRAVVKDTKGRTAASDPLTVKIVEGTKPSVTVENLYYKIGQEINLKDAITVNSGDTVTYFTKITDNATGNVVETIPNTKQNDFTVDFTFVDQLKRLVGHLTSKVYVLEGSTFHIEDKHAQTGSAINLLENISVTDTYGKYFGPDSGLIHVTEITGPKKVNPKDTVSFPAKGKYSVKYSFKDSLGLNWVYNANVTVHDPIKITANDVFTPQGYDVEYLDGVSAVDENGKQVVVTVSTIQDAKGKIVDKIDTSKVGTYTVTFSSVDDYGFETTKSVKFTVKKPPVIEGALSVIAVGSDVDLLESVRAHDDKGKELKVELEYVKDAKGNILEEWYTDTPQILTVKYYTEDGDGVSTFYENELRIKELPTIVASDVEFYHGQEYYIQDEITAFDADGKQLKVQVSDIKDKDGKVVKDWSLLAPGSYRVTLSVTDADGLKNSSEILVTVHSNSIPEILAEDVYLVVGEKWDPYLNVKARDKEDGDISHKVEIVSIKKRNTKAKMLRMARVPVDIDTSEPGVYDVVYRVEDRFGQETLKGIVVTITEKTPEEAPAAPSQEQVTSYVAPAAPAAHGVPTGVDTGMMGYIGMLVTSLGAITGLSRSKRRQK